MSRTLDPASIKLLSSFMDAVPFYVLLVDDQHHIVEANQTTCRHLHTTAGELIGKYCPRAVHGLEGPFRGCPLEDAVRTGGAVERELFDEASGRWVVSAIYPTGKATPEGRAVYLHLVRDITDQKRASIELEQASFIQGAVAEILRLSVGDDPLARKLERALQMIVSVPWIPLQRRGAIFVVSPDDPRQLEMVASCDLSRETVTACGRVAFGDCLCGQAAESGQIVHCSGLDEHHGHRVPGAPPHGHYCVPILSQGQTLGVIALYLGGARRRSPGDEVFLTMAADALSAVIRLDRMAAADGRSSTFRALFDQSPDGILLVDPASRLAVDWNPAAARLIDAQDLARLPVDGPECLGAPLGQAIDEIVAGGQRVDLSLQLRRAGREPRAVPCTVQPVTLPARRLIQVLLRDGTPPRLRAV